MPVVLSLKHRVHTFPRFPRERNGERRGRIWISVSGRADGCALSMPLAGPVIIKSPPSPNLAGSNSQAWDRKKQKKEKKEGDFRTGSVSTKDGPLFFLIIEHPSPPACGDRRRSLERKGGEKKRARTRGAISSPSVCRRLIPSDFFYVRYRSLSERSRLWRMIGRVFVKIFRIGQGGEEGKGREIKGAAWR